MLGEVGLVKMKAGPEENLLLRYGSGQLDWHALHQMAKKSTGTLTRYRALLGRLLLAIHRTDAHLEYGCSSGAHYALLQLGLPRKEALRLIGVGCASSTSSTKTSASNELSRSLFGSTSGAAGQTATAMAPAASAK